MADRTTFFRPASRPWQLQRQVEILARCSFAQLAPRVRTKPTQSDSLPAKFSSLQGSRYKGLLHRSKEVRRERESEEKSRHRRVPSDMIVQTESSETPRTIDTLNGAD